MAAAEVGDDVFGEDPTVNRLEARLAEMLGKEAAVFVSSGTMSNQIGVRVHCGPGDEFLCEAGCHIYNYEQGAYAQLSGVAARPVEGVQGVLEPQQLEGLIHRDDIHLVRTKLVCLENTHNRGGGRVLPYEGVEAICRWAHDNGLMTHLDGARLFNAVVGSGISAQEWSRHFDTVSVCFSKGLGAPVGSALAGPADSIQMARRHRKLFGGGMRQAGFIAAGALYALEHQVERLAHDHDHARQLADASSGIDGISLPAAQVDTNIVFLKIDPRLGTADEFAACLKQEGLLVLSMGPRVIRAVTHLDLEAQDVERAVEILARVAEECAAGRRPGRGETSAYA